VDRVDALVVGAGVVGLACADALARAGHEVVIAEAEVRHGSGISSRNSEVIHSGLYYPPGSLKARACVRGRRLLYDFCERAKVPHRRCGKLVVATQPAQQAALDALLARGTANGVEGLRLIDGDEARRLEPQLACHAALLSETTGIVDGHALMTALLGRAESHGAALALGTRFGGARRFADGWAVQFQDAGGAIDLHAKRLVIATGLTAPSDAARIDGFPPARVPPQRYAKGSYFALTGRAPFSRLVYPVPEADGLGVHLTLDLAGQARFGPDVEWVDTPDYDVDPARGDAFAEAIRRYWPRVEAARLRADYAGVRPKIYARGEPAADFDIAGPTKHGLPGVVCLFGIESPGLTAALALAEDVTVALA
jgi:L-2-hydroxyglutarate oxidase LhgO